MRVDNKKSFNSFKAASGNILAIGDLHGNIMTLSRVLKTIKNNVKDIFYKSAGVSNAIFCISW